MDINIRNQTIACWFSCGVASAVAAKKTIELYGNCNTVRVIYNPIAEEDSDNIRFLKDVEKWISVPVEFAINSSWPNASIVEVFDKRRYMGGIAGAPCTNELKKLARRQWEKENNPDWHVLGFTADETKRFMRFQSGERANTLPVLIDLGLNKSDCMRAVFEAGIEPPRVYGMGYPNANCIGCVKATSATYWNKVRETHPEVFAARSEQSRRIGAKLVRIDGERIFLDELPVNATGAPLGSYHIECGIFCEEIE